MTKPCPMPTDPEQALDMPCSICGKAISFTKSEVYLNWPSYVCKEHAPPYPHPGRQLLPCSECSQVTLHLPCEACPNYKKTEQPRGGCY